MCASVHMSDGGAYVFMSIYIYIYNVIKNSFYQIVQQIFV